MGITHWQNMCACVLARLCVLNGVAVNGKGGGMWELDTGRMIVCARACACLCVLNGVAVDGGGGMQGVRHWYKVCVCACVRVCVRRRRHARS